MFKFVFFVALTFHLSNCNVLKVKDDKNQTNMLRPVHKVPPIESLYDPEKHRRFEIKKRTDDDGVNENDQNPRHDSKQTVFAVNQAVEDLRKTIRTPEFRSSKTMSFIDKILDTLKAFLNGPEFRSSKTMRYIEKIIDIIKEAANGPSYRSGGQANNMRTDMVHFQSGQPSLVFELKPDFFLNFVKKVLSTKLVEKYMDDLTQEQHIPKKHLTRLELRKKANDDVIGNKKMRRDNKQTVFVINEAIDALKKMFGKAEFRSSKTMSLIDRVLDTIRDYLNGPQFRSSKSMKYIEKLIDIVKEAANKPEYRSMGQANMRTDTVHLQRGQPSLVFELKPNFFVDVVKKILSTQLVERYMDDLAHDQRKPKKHMARFP